MADLRIVDAPVLLQESITDDVKMPTGGLGNYAIRLGDLVWYVVTKEQLASKNYVDNSSKGVQDKLDNHVSANDNPHKVTKQQVGLGNVDNTADVDKPVSNAVSSAIITATNDMATKTYVNQKDNLKADKANTYTKDETYTQSEINSVLLLKADVSYVNTKDGDLATLTTTDKTNLVKAINEVHSNTKDVVDLYNKNVEVGATADSWSDLVIKSDNLNQRQINDGLDSVAQLLSIDTPRNGMRVIVKSYNQPNYALNKPFDNGGGTFVYDSTKATVNDGGIIINGWVRQDTKQIFASYFGAKGDGVTNDSPAFQKAVDYCEKNQIKTLRIANGDHLLNDKVYFYRGGVNVIGEGALQREESWIGVSTQKFPDLVQGREGDAFSGCSIIVPKNSTAFVFAKSVVDHVFFSMLQFKSKEGRTVGNTNAIDFFAEFEGPTWGFTVNYCHFRGFNKAVNIQSPTQYCVAFVEMSRNSFSQNDEVLYFGDLPQEKWDVVGSRNLTWGLTFEHNKCHDNARLIRACLAKDMCRISQNNLEGTIAYADGTHPKYSIDLEAYNCYILFEGNHAESVAHDIFFASTYMRKPDGTRHDFANNQTRGGGVTVETRANNFDGVSDAHKTVVLEGVNAKIIGYYPTHIHGCTVESYESGRHNLLSLADIGSEGGYYAFKLDNGFENIANSKNNNLSLLKNTFNTPDQFAFMLPTPFGKRQITKVYSGDGYYFGYTSFDASIIKNNKFVGISCLVNNSKASGFFNGSATLFVNYTDNGVTQDKYFNLQITCSLSDGWSIVTSVFSTSSIPESAIINSCYIGIVKSSIGDDGIIIDNALTLFAVATNKYYPAPYFDANKSQFWKQGTVEECQMFYDPYGVFNVCIDSGTVGNAITATATGVSGKNTITVTDASKIPQNSYLLLNGAKYRAVNVVNNTIYLDRAINESISNASLSFAPPAIKTVTLN